MVEVGSWGIALENIRKNETGLAYIPKNGTVKITAVENIKKYSEILIVDEGDKAAEKRTFEARTKPWNIYRALQLKPGEKVEVCKVNGEGTITGFGIYVEGSPQVVNTEISVFLDLEEYPSFKTTPYELYWLGGGYAPTNNPTGGCQIYDTTANKYGAYANINGNFTQKCTVTVKNVDTATRTIRIHILFHLRGTEVEVATSSGLEGGGGGNVPPPTQSGPGVVGGGAGATARVL